MSWPCSVQKRVREVTARGREKTQDLHTIKAESKLLKNRVWPGALTSPALALVLSLVKWAFTIDINSMVARTEN